MTVSTVAGQAMTTAWISVLTIQHVIMNVIWKWSLVRSGAHVFASALAAVKTVPRESVSVENLQVLLILLNVRNEFDRKNFLEFEKKNSCKAKIWRWVYSLYNGMSACWSWLYRELCSTVSRKCWVLPLSVKMSKWLSMPWVYMSWNNYNWSNVDNFSTVENINSDPQYPRIHSLTNSNQS